MKKSFRLSHRIAAGYFFLVLLTCMTCFIILKMVSENRNTGESSAQVIVPAINQLESLQAFVSESGALTQRIAESNSREDQYRLYGIYNEKYPAIRKQLRLLTDQQSVSSEFKEKFSTLFLEFERLMALQKNLLETTTKNFNQGTIKSEQAWLWWSAYRTRALPIEDKTKAAIAYLLAFEHTQLTKNNLQIKANNDILAATIILFMMLSMVGAFVFTWFTSRKINQPISFLKKTILSMSRGEIPEISRATGNDELGLITNALVELTESLKKKASYAVETGNGNYNSRFTLLSEQDELGIALVEMNKSLRLKGEEMQKESWLKNGIARMSEILRNEHSNTGVLYTNIISFLSRYLVMNQGALYLTKEDRDKNKYFEMVAGFACDKNKSLNKRIGFSEGYVGQVAEERKLLVLNGIPGEYFKINSGLGEALPKNIIVAPLLFEKELKGVLELATFTEITPLQMELLEQLSSIIAATLDLIDRKMHTELLLFESQDLNDKLMEREEALSKSNEDLLEKGNLLKVSEEELREQQEELMQTNAQLEEKAQLLAEQNEEIRMKNEQLEVAKEAIRIKAEEVENTSRYKSEFLANMSHELRTPLNSILILSNLLNENKDGNLTERQIEYARVVKRSGADLLNLINDILDLSKIESRNMELDIAEIPLQEVGTDMESLFRELANDRKVNYSVTYQEGLVRSIHSDKMRIEQVLKNLLSNAFKFTDKNGRVTLSFENVRKDHVFNNSGIDSSKPMISISVSDTGIGIPPEKQQLIFEAFKQADGSTSRKYGGTGLGLSISKELSLLLKGEVQIKSTPGEGSTFTLYLPVSYSGDENQTSPATLSMNETATLHTSAEKKSPVYESVIQVEKADRLVLIIEDDPDFAKILQNHATKKGFTGMIANRGDTGLINAKRFKPDAIILDLNLPGMDGWSVMRRLKEDPELRHIPIHVLSGQHIDEKTFPDGAIEVLQKPVGKNQLNHIFENITRTLDTKLKRVLIIEDNPSQVESIRALLDNPELECYSAMNGKEALEILNNESIDLVTLDLSLPDIQGLDLLKKIRSSEQWKKLPVIIYTGKNLSMEESRELSKYSASIIVKTERSFERLLDETNLFLNKLEPIPEVLPQDSVTHLKPFPSGTPPVSPGISKIKGKKVLVVDDDIRNIFALTSILEQENCELVIAHDGREALRLLDQNTDTDIVLMDIMMPEMDGYEAMKQIRNQDRFSTLPIVALTAKAMKGDKEKCIEAGASGYLSKPVDTSKLITIMSDLLFQ